MKRKLFQERVRVYRWGVVTADSSAVQGQIQELKKGGWLFSSKMEVQPLTLLGAICIRKGGGGGGGGGGSRPPGCAPVMCGMEAIDWKCYIVLQA